MPIYEYQCSACHHAFDVLQKMSDDAIKQCPECSQDTAVKLVSAAGFQLKGTGWYETDFKHKDKPKAKANTAETPAKKTKTGSTD
jgi:putative FmdB family regulatory protein